MKAPVKSRRRAPRRGRRNTRGTAAVEFGLVLPVFLVLLLGIIDWGWAFHNQLQITNACREGARAGVVQEDTTSAETVAQGETARFLSIAGINSGYTLTTTVDNGVDPPTLEVEVDLTFTPLVGFVPTPPSLKSRALMRMESFSP